MQESCGPVNRFLGVFVDEKQQVMSFKLSEEEAEAIKTAASTEGISVSEYLRNRAVPRSNETSPANLEPLIHHLIYMVNRLHIAVFSIPEVAGTLSTDQLRTIYDSAAPEAVEWMAELPKHMAKLQAQITGHTSAAAPATNKGAA
jgi:hypothetical protein